MELNQISKRNLKIVRRKLQCKKVAYTEKGYTAIVLEDGKHVFHNEIRKESYKIPSFFNIMHYREKLISQDRPKIGRILLQSLSYINCITKKNYTSISGFKPCNV